MNTLATIVQQFETDLRQRYRLLPGHQRALDAFKRCRNDLSPSLQLHCSQCENRHFVPHSCGHRSCPHCQHFETEQWIQRQCQRTVPAPHYLLTFTLPKQLRTLAFNHQRIVYDALMQCAFQTIAQFTKGDPKLNGKPGAIAVLHTHSRQLHFHPHVHLIVPAAAVDTKRNLWRTKDNYLFNQRALAKVFRAKCFKRWKQAHLNWPKHAPNKWLVHCKSIGDAKPAIVYLGRYLYRGVLPSATSSSAKTDKSPFDIDTPNRNNGALEPCPARNSFGSCYSTSCPKAFTEAVTLASCIPMPRPILWP